MPPSFCVLVLELQRTGGDGPAVRPQAVADEAADSCRPALTVTLQLVLVACVTAVFRIHWVGRTPVLQEDRAGVLDGLAEDGLVGLCATSGNTP